MNEKEKRQINLSNFQLQCPSNFQSFISPEQPMIIKLAWSLIQKTKKFIYLKEFFDGESVNRDKSVEESTGEVIQVGLTFPVLGFEQDCGSRDGLKREALDWLLLIHLKEALLELIKIIYSKGWLTRWIFTFLASAILIMAIYNRNFMMVLRLTIKIFCLLHGLLKLFKEIERLSRSRGRKKNKRVSNVRFLELCLRLYQVIIILVSLTETLMKVLVLLIQCKLIILT